MKFTPHLLLRSAHRWHFTLNTSTVGTEPTACELGASNDAHKISASVFYPFQWEVTPSALTDETMRSLVYEDCVRSTQKC